MARDEVAKSSLLAGAISRIGSTPDHPFNHELVVRANPIEWKNIIFYAEIRIDPDKLKIRGR